MKKTQDKIIRTYYTISGLFTISASLIWGINTLFLLHAGMSIFQVFVVNAIYSASMAIFEIPTGVFADTLGRRLAFLLSTIVLMIGTFGYAFAATLQNNFWAFGLMSVVLGLAYTLYSGTVEAWLVDALLSTGYTRPMDHVFSRSTTISSIGMLFGTVLGGFLGTLNLSIPYIVRASVILIVFGIAFIKMHDLGYTKKALAIRNIPKEMKKIASTSIEYGLKNLSVRYLMMVSFVFSSFMMWGWYAWPPYFLDLFGNAKAVWLAGIISALFSLAQVGGSLCVGPILALLKKRTRLLILAFAIQSVALIGVGILNSFYPAVALFLCFSFAMGLAMPVKQAYLHSLIPSEQRASIVSFDSLVGSSGSVIGQIGYGYLSDRASIGIGYLVGGFVNLIILPVLYLLSRRKDGLDSKIEIDLESELNIKSE